MQKGFHRHVRHAVRQPQAAPPLLSRGHCNLCNEVKGQKSALASRAICASPTSCFRAAAQVREAHGRKSSRAVLSAVKARRRKSMAATSAVMSNPPTSMEDRLLDRRFAENQAASARSLLSSAARGNSVPAVFVRSPGLHSSRARIARAPRSRRTKAAWDNLHERFGNERINHQRGLTLSTALHQSGRGIFSRLRRAEIGIHHHIAGALSAPLCAGVVMARITPRLEWHQVNRIAHLALSAASP